MDIWRGSRLFNPGELCYFASLARMQQTRSEARKGSEKSESYQMWGHHLATSRDHNQRTCIRLLGIGSVDMGHKPSNILRSHFGCSVARKEDGSREKKDVINCRGDWYCEEKRGVWIYVVTEDLLNEATELVIPMVYVTTTTTSSKGIR